MKRRTNPRRKGSMSKSKPGRVNPRHSYQVGDRVREKYSKVTGTILHVHGLYGYMTVKWDDGDKTYTDPRDVIRVIAKGPGSRLPNPPTVIYGRVLRIEAQKTQPHACDADCASRDHKYYHDFKKGSQAMIVGMPAGVDSKDRSLRIVSKGKK